MYDNDSYVCLCSFVLYCVVFSHRYKLDPELNLTQQKVIAIPDISIYDRRKPTTSADVDDDLMVLACDGVFDVMDNVTVVRNIREIVETMQLMSENADVIANKNSKKSKSSGNNNGLVKYSDAARILISSCLALQSTDNISVCIVPLNNCK